ncbi:hypothetical protein YC2023_123226 [Brassica napus]
MVGLVSILQFSRGPCGVVSRSSGLLDRGVALSSSPPLVSRALVVSCVSSFFSGLASVGFGCASLWRRLWRNSCSPGCWPSLSPLRHLQWIRTSCVLSLVSSNLQVFGEARLREALELWSGSRMQKLPSFPSACGGQQLRISLGSCHDASSVSAGFVLRICVLVSAGFVLRIGIVSLCWVRAASLYGLVTLWFSKRRRETGIRTLKRRRETKIHTLKRRRETRVRAD